MFSRRRLLHGSLIVGAWFALGAKPLNKGRRRQASAGRASGTGAALGALTIQMGTGVGGSVTPAAAMGSGTGRDALVAGATFYIAPTGNDTTGTGTFGAPWATIAKFITRPPVAGDTLYCRGGTYSGLAGNRNNYMPASPGVGTASKPITIKAYPGETPVFEGGAGTTLNDRHFLAFRNGSHYWTLDGLTLQGYCQGFFGVVQIGSNSPSTYADHVTIRNCTINLSSPLAGNSEHAIYLLRGDSLLIDDCYLKGPLDAVADTGSGVHIYNNELGGPTNYTIRGTIFEKWQDALLVWETSATGVIEWNTLHNNASGGNHIWANRHSTLLVRNNVGESGTTFFNDPINFASTTQNNNYGTQTLNADGSLQAGSAAINGAHDGSDAGAIDYP